jgi:chemotaxis methyl-accepting protein methylase
LEDESLEEIRRKKKEKPKIRESVEFQDVNMLDDNAPGQFDNIFNN